MNWLGSHLILMTVVLTAVAGCETATDAATRLASDIEAGADRLGSEDDATYSIQHDTPSKSGECTGPYKVQLDRVGAMIIWCKDAAGEIVSSHSTSYHARFVDTPQTFLLDKDAGTTLTIDLERHDGRAVIADVR
ncbi:MAG: hypothetical protein ACRES3_03345 [Steroidobacteraceae bacterium]